ncbi:hypothetical protein FVR03_21560 [Pontibacter qinzhouensis]|uniref:Uncharacterized protein n=1 Tax=Pontibacter qinzhouensis TaxID=2603253 RepID=A0A5C8J018_9BACT|nr:hypothetical protein [Pontibacter qinzhouensis]TXK26685.1 hypothetical protein FVR03_21560 [Pontibacter qinzhouensis]
MGVAPEGAAVSLPWYFSFRVDYSRLVLVSSGLNRISFILKFLHVTFEPVEKKMPSGTGKKQIGCLLILLVF